ncbi:hypothetical protein BDV59DRAFT_149530 [Aspergillus ambiguus]|uniref:uncharacterized protein n=1 Tax=Aspergillus ambiguus TaxID=176160 RepID=UPI003CCD5B3D
MHSFPNCAFDALEKFHPGCELYLQDFRFDTLHDTATVSTELRITINPNLRHLTISIRYYIDYNYNVVLIMVGGISKGLHSVDHEYCPTDSEVSSSKVSDSDPEWRGFVPDTEPFKRGASRNCRWLG